jgi:predicted O-methyltransferase YrrM
MVSNRLAPGSGLASTAYRVRMAAALVRAVPVRHRSAGALAAALRTTALGRIPPEERAWLARIEAYRRELPARAAAAAPQAERPGAERLAEAKRASQWMSIPPALGCLLTRLVRELAPRSALELGTGFGVSAAYQAAALELNAAGEIATLDVDGMITIAEPGLERLGLSPRVELVPGEIESTLSGAVERRAPIDYALLDADHTEAGTRAAFEAILPGLAAGAVVVLDDINWTDGMKRAWRMVREHPRVVGALELGRLGFAIVGAGAPRA